MAHVVASEGGCRTCQMGQTKHLTWIACPWHAAKMETTVEILGIKQTVRVQHMHSSAHQGWSDHWPKPASAPAPVHPSVLPQPLAGHSIEVMNQDFNTSRSHELVFWVVVLGDFGRSPRMQYHALSLSQKPRARVYVLAYPGSKPLQQLLEANNVRMITVPEPHPWLRKLPRLLSLAFKVLLQLWQLLWLMLLRAPKPNCILLQNPPAIPTLALCTLAAWRHRAKLVVDWHNYGYTILALGMRPGHWLVKLARAHEKYWGRQGHSHFCVTRAMQQDLQANWGITATVLHDRPPAFFQRTPLPTIHDLFTRLEPLMMDPAFHDFLTDWLAMQAPRQQLSPTHTGESVPAGSTIVSTQDGTGIIKLRPGRPAIVISSTSWTPDEDFSILLEAAILYDDAASQPGAEHLPQVLFLITGKGPQRAQYLDMLRQRQFKKVAFRSLWVESADYPLLLGAADVGVSLHASSSGLDLPMKVVDMFGSGLPVCALSYSCISELVTDAETGLLFTTAQQLSTQLQQLLTGFNTKPSKLLTRLQQGVMSKQQSLRWSQNWDAIAWPVLKQ